jgi:hypothetical protein
MAEVAAREIKDFHSFGERLNAETFRPLCPLFPVFAKGVALGMKTAFNGTDRARTFGIDLVLGRDSSERNTGFDLFHVPGALLGASSTGRAPPDVFALDIGQPEGRFPDELSHAERPDPVPRADRVAQSALEASLEGLSAARLDDLDDLFVRGYSFHDLYVPLLSPFFASMGRTGRGGKAGLC